jgi:probable HAF family extracellular repeat protein
MRPLPTLGGNNGYAAGMNRGDVIAGWAESSTKDATCVAPQQLQFLPVVWNAKTLAATRLPTLTVHGKLDPDGAATAANDRDEVIGISGICDQAVGRFTARHAVVWQHGKPMQLQTLGGVSWNTPTAINNRGQIVGFVNRPGKSDKAGIPNFISAIWDAPGDKPTKIEPLPSDALSEPTAINDSGQVVGVSFPSSHVYVWKNGKIVDLTAMMAKLYPDLKLVSVGGINDKGEIAGQACRLTGGTCPASNATFVTFVASPQ